MEGLELICFQIISSVGSAKSSFIEAAKVAQTYDFDTANQKICEGDDMLLQGHKAHATLIQQEASGTPVTPSMLLMHAEDQLMAAESFKAFAQQQIVIFKKFQMLEERTQEVK